MKSNKQSINNLILFCLYSSGKRFSFEELAKECFSRFPERFSFSKIKKWPDSRKLDSSLRKLRKRKLITGNPKTFFKLTNLGRKTTEEIAKVFRQRKLKL